MTYPIGETHNPQLRSWVDSANGLATDFPIQNLPLGVFCSSDSEEGACIAVAIGQYVLNLRRARSSTPFQPLSAAIRSALSSNTLNAFMELGPASWSELRLLLSRALRADSPHWRENRSALQPSLLPATGATMQLPAHIGDYTDFYASIHHATRVGRLFRPDNPLLPNYKYIPIGYHGRASSVIVSGQPVTRPCGQVKPRQAERPLFQPSQALDYELELGFVIGCGNALGSPASMQHAESQIFGFCLLNDWSARDIQSWEYQPLGPFLAKNFATTISPWVVTSEALAPFRVPALAREPDDPAPLPYLHSDQNEDAGAFDINLEVLIQSEGMKDKKLAPVRLSRSNTKYLFWTPAQLVAHHASNGCNLRTGDLLATGTISGPETESAGCLLELTENGARPISLPGGATRTFLEDGDEITLLAGAERDGFVRIGFGECRGRIVQAKVL